ncbi:hypothetical protein T08_13587 [Trichinella sp. T8]|nr:hypothetical protein T08_13587 [Trichinella sp. T8]
MTYKANSNNHNAIVAVKHRNDHAHKVPVAECQRQCLPSHLHKVTLLT